MTYQEYVMWGLFLRRNPPGWEEDDRAYKILRALGVKSPPESIFWTLSRMKDAQEKAKEDAKPVPRTGSFVHSMLMKAKGGKKLDFLKDL
jgi:hypothetical protein